MINKNQFEKSIIVLKENLPIVIRNGYNKFDHVLRTVIDALNSLNEERPASVEKITNSLLNGSTSLFYLFSSLVEENEFKNFIHKMNNDTAAYDRDVIKLNSDEEFSLVNSTDFYAPLNEIRFSLTAFNSEKFRNLKWKNTTCNVPIVFEASYNGEYSTDNEKINPVLNSSYITNLFGRKTILDKLKTCCIVDFSRFCDRLFYEIVKSINIDNISLNSLISIKDVLDSDKVSNDLLTKIEKDIMASAVATYLVYASKLIGAKPDIFQWAYSAFVKDAQSHFDKSHYPLNAPVTVSSGHSVTGYTYGNKNSKYNEATMDMNTAQIDRHGGDDSSDPTKALIYRNIRLNHSAWSSVMNTILSGCPRNVFKDSINEEEFRNANKGYRYDDNTKTNIYGFTVSVLSEYIKSKTRTYNTSIQLTQNLKINESANLINFSANQIKESNSTNIIKHSITGYSENDLFLPYDENVAGLLTLNTNVSKTLADTFLDASYLLLLNHSHNAIGNIIEETDPITGKTNKELFEEIYYGISSKINIDIEKYSYHEKCITAQNNIDASIAAYTPYFSCTTCKNDIDDELRGVINTGSSLPYPDYDPYEYDIYSPLISEYTYLKNRYCIDDINKNATIATIVERNRGRFPKNRLVTTALSYCGKNAEKRAFASLESFEEYLISLESLSEEGADAMANNAAYSALGTIGGAITELEITNSADHNTTDNIPLDSAETDNDDYLIKESSGDAEYMTKVISGSLESLAPKVKNKATDLIKKYNSIFNKMLLN